MEYHVFTRLNRPTYVNSTTVARNVWGIEWSTEASSTGECLRKFLDSKHLTNDRVKEIDSIFIVPGDQVDSFISDKIIIDDTAEEIINKGLDHDILARTIEETTRIRSRSQFE